MSTDTQNLSSFGQELIKAAQDNPIPAALIGMGVLWWFSGGHSATLSGVRTPVTGGQLADAAGRVGGAGRSAVAGVANFASDVGGKISEASSDMGLGASDAMETAVVSATRYGFALQNDLADLLERRPLALGAIGLCLGVAAAAAFPSTSTEDAMFGDSSDALKDKAKSLIDEGTEAAGNLTASVKNAVMDEGISVGGVTATGKDLLERAGAVADKAFDAAQSSVARPKA